MSNPTNVKKQVKSNSWYFTTISVGLNLQFTCWVSLFSPRHIYISDHNFRRLGWGGVGGWCLTERYVRQETAQKASMASQPLQTFETKRSKIKELHYKKNEMSSSQCSDVDPLSNIKVIMIKIEKIQDNQNLSRLK